MAFVDRADAGRQLARRLEHLRDQNPVVLGLPRGGVPVASEVAYHLDAPLDVIIVRKLGVPFQPELGLGAIGEEGVSIVNGEVVRAAGLTPRDVSTVETRERAELELQARLLRSVRPRVPLNGRTVVIVDDGIATGSTARVACQVARAHGAGRVVLAVPVAPPDWESRIGPGADELISLETPEQFFAVGQFYTDFSPTTDAEVVACLQRSVGLGEARARTTREQVPEGGRGRDEEILAPVAGGLAGHLSLPKDAGGLVVFAHGSGSSRHSPRNQQVAAVLNRSGLATLLFDLLGSSEESDRNKVFDIPLLAERLRAVTTWLRGDPHIGSLPVGFFGASTGAGAALWAASDPDLDIAAVVSRGGRPDLAHPRLSFVRAPTLLIVGGLDAAVLDLNRQAQARLVCENHLTVVPGATHLFEEPGALDVVAEAAGDWFARHLLGPSRPRPS